MAEVRVDITGDNSGLKRALTDSEKKLKGFSSKAASSTRSLANSLSSGAEAAKRLGGVFAGGLGIAAASAGMKAFGAIARDVLAKARREAQLTQAAFNTAFNKAVAFDIPSDTFTITTREDAVKAGQFAKKELNRVVQDLERNFGSLINSDTFAGLLSGALNLSSVVGIGTDEKNRLNLLLEQRDIIQSQVDKYRQIEQSLTFQSKLAASLQRQGLTPDSTGASGLAAPRPNFGGAISPGGPLLSLAEFAGPLPGAPGPVDDIIDPSITLKLLDLQRAVDAGVIPALQGMNQEAGLLQQQLLFMLDSGVSPANVQFQEMLGRMQGLQVQTQGVTGSINAGAVAFKVIGEVGASALTGLLLKFEEANSAAARLRNSLRSVVGQFAQLALRAGIAVGVGALTGNPLTFGAALASAVGISAPTVAGTASAAAPSLSAAGRSPSLSIPSQQLEAVVRGDELAVMLRNSEAGRDGRGGRILN